MTVPALLRAPPFPGLVALPAPAVPAPAALAPEGAERTALFGAVREARVGGTFWHAAPKLKKAPETLLRVRSPAEMAALRSEFADPGTLWAARDVKLARETDLGPDIDPWALLLQAQRLVAHGDDEWVALARIAGVPVYVLSPGPFGEPGECDEMLDTRAAKALARPMRDPFAQGWLQPLEAVRLLADWRRVIEGNRGGPGEAIVAACGMSWWKREEIRRFLWLPEVNLRLVRNTASALSHAAAQGGALAVWPSRVSPRLIVRAKALGVPLVRVEDGFVRSAGLGSNLVPPSSVVVDRQGIHFDPRAPSDLETILSETEFSPHLLERAIALRKAIVAARISKYATGSAAPASAPRSARARKVVLVPGQVEDDMSVLAGGGGLTSNLELLRRARDLEPEAEIWWRPHPDVDAGHRKGIVADDDALAHADRIVREGSMADLLGQVDALHVLTSLSGFEALLRGLDVTCHGTPFFAGWGLTRDMAATPGRRRRTLSLDELVAGVLLLYPRYLDPVTGLPCPPEVLVQRMAHGQMPNRLSWVEPLRRAQGRLVTRWRRQGKERGTA